MSETEVAFMLAVVLGIVTGLGLFSLYEKWRGYKNKVRRPKDEGDDGVWD